MSASIPGASGDVCITMKSDAERSAGSAPTSTRSASMPPAEAPTTMISFGMKHSPPRAEDGCYEFRVKGIKIEYTYSTSGSRIAPKQLITINTAVTRKAVKVSSDMSETFNDDPVTLENLQIHRDGNFLVVGLGASAGGIQALRDFFSNVPARTEVAYVVILHLSPDHDSQLAEVLQSASALPVTKVEHRVHVEPNHVYVIPPNKSLEINDGHIDVSTITSNEVRRAPVDIFFRTLARSHGPRAVSVVLSGTGANGSMGMKAVKEMVFF